MLPLTALLLLFTATASAGVTAAATAGVTAAALQQPPKIEIFILAGQSNMAGRGGVNGNRWDHFIPPECRPSPSILRLSAGLRWHVAREPLHSDIDTNKTCGVGPGMPFANAVLADGAAAPLIGLVPCAVGGTKIGEWARGTHLYNNLVRRGRVAVEGGGRLAAMVWYQGESDTVLEADAREYGGRLRRLISDLRRDLKDPNMIVIQVVIASGEGKYVGLVRAAQKGAKLENLFYVDAEGLQLEHDNLHLTTQSQVMLGNMLASAYFNHTPFSPNLSPDL